MSLRHRSAALALCCLASAAHAHAPLARGLAVASDSGAIALRMPGFGWLLRSPSSFAGKPVFEYACDALLGVSPLEEKAPMAYRSDGALLVGTARGLRVLTREGCPTSATPLSGQPVTAVAVHATAVDRVYAVTEAVDLPPFVQRSDDGGESWTVASSLAYPVTALVLDPADPQALYVSETTGQQRSSVVVSSDGGESFETFEQDRDLTLLLVQANPRRLWAMERVPNAPVGVTILRAERAQGPWDELLTVNFFGGLAIDPNDADVIWVGDEARGVFRSSDGGDSFDETQPSIASACLAYGAYALWSCTPGLPEETALVRSSDAIQPFEPIMAFADVDHLVDCGAAVDVEQVCAAAWVEWRRDILALPPALPDAGMMNRADAASAPDAEVAVDAAVKPKPPRGSAQSEPGCAVIAARRAPSLEWLCALAALSLVARRCSRHSRGDKGRDDVAPDRSPRKPL